VGIPEIFQLALVSIVVSATGLLLRKPLIVLTGAFIGLPFMAYALAAPRFGLIAALATLGQFGAALATGRRRPWLACLLFAPAPFLIWYVAAAVTNTLPGMAR